MGGPHVTSARQLEVLFLEMLPFFEGKETEQNWPAREKSILKLRELTEGHAPHLFTSAYLTGIKTLLDGILKTVNSLRTTLSTNGCHLLQSVAKAAGSGLDPMVEILLQNLIKLCGGTKKISAQNGNETVNAILANVTYSARLMHHIWNACQDKNVQPRTFATGWLKTIITKHGHHKNVLEHAGGLELIEKCIKKGLEDANPGVKEGMRGTYWAFHRVWPEKSEAIMSALESKQQVLLAKDPGNPNANNATKVNGPSLKETIAAQKNTKAAGQNPHLRPQSAQATSSSSTAQEQSNLHKPTDPKTTRPSLKETIAAQKKAKMVGKDLPLRSKSALAGPSISTTKKTNADQTDHSTSTTDKPKAGQTDLSISTTEKPKADQADPFISTTKKTNADQTDHSTSTTDKPKAGQTDLSISTTERTKADQTDPSTAVGAPEPTKPRTWLAGPRRRPRKDQDICFIKPKPRVKATPPVVSKPRVLTLESPKPVRAPMIDVPGNANWRKCAVKHMYPAALRAILTARMNQDSGSHTTFEMEREVENMTDFCKTDVAMDIVLGMLETSGVGTETEKEKAIRLTTMGLGVLSRLLRRVPRMKLVLTEIEIKRLTTLPPKCLSDEDADVRKAAIDYCLDLHDVIDSKKFWPMAAEAGTEHRDLLIYYLKKNGKVLDL